MPYAVATKDWAIEEFGISDEDFLNADTNDDLALAVIAARKKETGAQMGAMFLDICTVSA